jgi:hypothetical protein
LVAWFALASFFWTNAQAQNAPPVLPGLKEAVAHIPIPGIAAALQDLHAALKQGENGGYFAKTTADVPGVGKIPLQLYFYGDGAKQALILVVDRELQLPPVFNNAGWKRLEGASLSDPIFSLSTVDYALDIRDMPEDFRKIVADSYYGVTSLNFVAGFQVAAKIRLGGAMKQVIEHSMNVHVQDFTLRAGVVVPIPTDASSSAALAAQLAADMKNVDKVAKDSPDFFVELQPKPGAIIHGPLAMEALTLTDATFSLTSHSVFGFRGNVVLSNGKKFITYFQTPLTEADYLDFADFQFGITAQTFTLEDYVLWCLSMATPKAPGGNFIKGVDKYKDQLLLVMKPLSVFEIRNPNPVGEYRFGDITKPFPHKSFFNMLVLGPLASSTDSTGQQLSGPYLQAIGDLTVLKQKLASVRFTMGGTGLHGIVDSGLSLNLGPLGRTGIKMYASADVTDKEQLILVQGSALGRALKVSLTPTRLSIDSPATCATPFELEQTLNIDSLLNLSSLMDSLPGVNVDPAKLQNCIGKELEAAYNWVASTGSALGGYAASQATAELNKMANEAAAAAKQADEEYNKAKDAARKAANVSTNGAMKAFNDAGNGIKKLFGKKKKHKKGPDPKFASSVFDWDYYYDAAPDVVRHKVDLATHWRDNGFNEGRQGSPEFSARYYLARYPDVKAKCGTDLKCALDHWLDHGIDVGRQGSANFSVADYLARYPDLQRAFGQDNYEDALDHWLNTGSIEGRNGAPNSTSPGPAAGPIGAGGGGGSRWSDRDVCKGGVLTGFKVDYGDRIDGVQFQYNYGPWAAAHGRTRHKVSVSLPQGETITRIEFSSGSQLGQLIFHTNRGKKYGPYGKGTINGSFTALAGDSIGCLAGRAGDEIDKLVISSTGLR